VLPILLEVGDVRDDDIDAEKFGLWKHHAGIDHNHVVPDAQDEHVHAKLAQSTERNC